MVVIRDDPNKAVQERKAARVKKHEKRYDRAMVRSRELSTARRSGSAIVAGRGFDMTAALCSFNDAVDLKMERS
jgi:hypothetical protein